MNDSNEAKKKSILIYQKKATKQSHQLKNNKRLNESYLHLSEGEVSGYTRTPIHLDGSVHNLTHHPASNHLDHGNLQETIIKKLTGGPVTLEVHEL